MAKMSSCGKWVSNRIDLLLHTWGGVSRVLKGVHDVQFKEILEIGAGAGVTTGFIEKRFPDARIVATDFDEEQIAVARRKSSRTNVEYRTADAMNLPFQDGSFDACFAILVFHHLEDYPKGIREAFRVLKSGGRLYVYDFAFADMAWLIRKLACLDAEVLFGKKEFSDQLRAAGFSLQSVNGNRTLVIEARKPLRATSD